MADKWGWKLPETRVFEVRPEAGRVKRKKWSGTGPARYAEEKKRAGVPLK